MKVERISFFVIFLFLCFNFCAFANEKLFNVVISEPSSDKRAFAFVDTVTNKNRIVEVAKNGEVIWEWEFPKTLLQVTSNICKGADIKYLKSTDQFLFVLPRQGAYILGRDGRLKTIVEDEFISHDIDMLPNGNYIYTRGWVNKGEDEVREINKSGEIVWKWSHVKYFPDRDKFLTDFSKRRVEIMYKRGTLKKNGIDWAHANGVDRHNNGNTLISLRNFQMFVIVGSDGTPIEYFKNLNLVHEPHKINAGYIASDRRLKKGYLRHSIVLIDDDNKRTHLLEGQFRTIRGIEKIGEDRFNITSISNVIEIDTKGKIYQRMHLAKHKEDAESDLHSRDLRELQKNKTFKEKCGLLPLYKVVKTKVY